MIFHPDDNALLEFQEDDGQRIEPKTYMPVIPMVLVNGSNGIGTGWSTSIPNYNPMDIIARLKALIEVVCDGTKTHNMLSLEDVAAMRPWYNGFKGSVAVIDQKETKVIGPKEVAAVMNDRNHTIDTLPFTAKEISDDGLIWLLGFCVVCWSCLLGGCCSFC